MTISDHLALRHLVPTEEAHQIGQHQKLGATHLPLHVASSDNLFGCPWRTTGGSSAEAGTPASSCFSQNHEKGTQVRDIQEGRLCNGAIFTGDHENSVDALLTCSCD